MSHWLVPADWRCIEGANEVLMPAKVQLKATVLGTRVVRFSD